MRATSRFVAVCCVGAVFLASCGSSSSDSSSTTTAKAKETTTTVPVDKAAAAFCTDAKTYLKALNELSTGIERGTTTIGDVKNAADEAKKASAAASDSKAALIGAIEAQAAAAATSTTSADSSTTTSTTLVPKEVATAHLDALEKAEQEAADAVASVDEATVIKEASATVQAAAFNLQLAWGQLYADAGCLADDAAGVAAIHEYVVGLQTDLKTIGLYTGDIDGMYGPATVAAVSTLQKNAGLPETGFLDPASQKALAIELAKASKQESLQVAAIQGALTSGGYYTGPIDGIWSPAVDTAIQALQADQQLEKDGATDPATLIALGIALAVEAQKQTTTTTGPTTTAAPTTTVEPTTTVAPTTEMTTTTTQP